VQKTGKRLSALPNIGPYIYNAKISGLYNDLHYTYDISRLTLTAVLVTKHLIVYFTAIWMLNIMFALMFYQIAVITVRLITHSTNIW
jgi:hypothetical protein